MEADALAKLAESTERNWEAVSELSAAANRMQLAAEKMGSMPASSARVTFHGDRTWAAICIGLSLIVIVWAVGEVRVANAGRDDLRSRLEKVEAATEVNRVYIQHMREQRAKEQP